MDYLKCMKVATDNNIFNLQKFGGISRIFSDYLDNGVINVKLDLPHVRPRLNYKQRILRKLKLKSYDKEVNINQIIDQVECDLFHPSYYGDYDLENIKTPFVITVYDMIHEIYPEIFNINATSNEKIALLPHARRIIAISQTTKDDIVRIMGLNGDKIDVVPLYTRFCEIQSLAIPDDVPSKFILYVGGRAHYKNFKRFIEAVKPIMEKIPDLSIVCTGNGFNIAEKSYFNKLNLKNRIFCFLCDNDSQLKYLYERAECFVFPSMYEGFGFPLLEAFSSKCPVVCSNAGSLPEVGGDACVYFNPLDIKEMGEKIETVIHDRAIKNQLISNGLKRLKIYTIENTMKLTLECYKRALSS